MASSSITLNVRPKWPGTKDHYEVWFEDHDIGRILLARDVSETAWEWSIVLPMQLAAWTRGSADSRDGAIRDFSSAWGRLLKETAAERLQRAWEFDRAAQSRLSKKEPSFTASH
jgi:hypothetical protein